MRSVRSFALGLAALSMVAFLAPSGAFAEVPGTQVTQVTMGDFIGAYAKAMKIELPADAGVDTIVAALKASGVKLDAGIDATKALTQGDVVRLGKANGLRLTSRSPETLFTGTEMDQFFATYSNSLGQGDSTRVAASDNPPGDPAGHANTDKGKKKGRPFQSPTEPE